MEDADFRHVPAAAAIANRRAQSGLDLQSIPAAKPAKPDSTIQTIKATAMGDANSLAAVGIESMEAVPAK